MTENEKAASFIGWKPSCMGRVKFVALDHCRCEEGHYFDVESPRLHEHWINQGMGWMELPHDVPCPDMSDPRNYMQALEGLGEQIHPILGIRPDTGEWTCYFLKSQFKSRLSHCEGGTAAEAAVKALAALYDAEHPE